MNCASNATHYSFAVFHTELLEHSNYSVESCQDPVYALVETDSLDRLLKMNYMQVLQKGFFLQWDGTNCRDCQSSGGLCGVQNNEFICICKDQPQQRTCLHGNLEAISLNPCLTIFPFITTTTTPTTTQYNPT